MITYKVNCELNLNEVIELYNSSTLGARRPTQQPDRMALMLKHANLIVSAWDDKILVGIGRSFSDFAYTVYMSDLAVRESYQKKGIGKEIIKITQDKAGANCTLLLTAAPEAEDYYPKIGFVNVPQCWVLPAEDKLPYYRKIGATNRTEWKI